jgi:lysophospholipase L1-like esterase
MFCLVRSSFFQRDDQLGWVPRAQIVGEHPYNGTMVPFHTNSRGFRDREHPIQNAPGTTRIVVLGDSYTWGYRVRDEEVYPEVLESLLENVEVINLGVTAYATEQELLYFKREGLQFHPDIVLLAFCQNDFDEADGKILRRILAETAVPNPVVAKKAEAEPSGLFSNIKRWINERSVLYGWIRDRINSNRALVSFFVKIGLKGPLSGIEELDVNILPALKPVPVFLNPLMELAKSRLLELRDLLAVQGIRLIVVLVPAPQSVDAELFGQSIAHTRYEPKDFDLDQPYLLMEGFAKTNHIELINPLESFRRSHHSSASLYLFRDMHFSPKGHEVFAQEIARYLRDSIGHSGKQKIKFLLESQNWEF